MGQLYDFSRGLTWSESKDRNFADELYTIEYSYTQVLSIMPYFPILIKPWRLGCRW